MQYVNLTEHTLRFAIGGKAYEVEPMTVEGTGECDIPDGLAYAVNGYGLPLTPKADVEPAPTPAPKTPTPAAPVASASSVESATVSGAESVSTPEPRRRGR
jgi:hypothetical protein